MRRTLRRTDAVRPVVITGGHREAVIVTFISPIRVVELLLESVAVQLVHIVAEHQVEHIAPAPEARWGPHRIIQQDERVIIRTKLEKPSKIKGLALI